MNLKTNTVGELLEKLSRLTPETPIHFKAYVADVSEIWAYRTYPHLDVKSELDGSLTLLMENSD